MVVLLGGADYCWTPLGFQRLWGHADPGLAPGAIIRSTPSGLWEWLYLSVFPLLILRSGIMLSDCLSRHMRGVVPQKKSRRVDELLFAGRMEGWRHEGDEWHPPSFTDCYRHKKNPRKGGFLKSYFLPLKARYNLIGFFPGYSLLITDYSSKFKPLST